MEKTRLEAFTDGVFAIVVTLLVLDIHLPAGTTAGNLGANLHHVLPALGTYVLSYLIVGMYWIFHHSAARMFKSVDTRILWLNVLQLMLVGLIPFSTSLLSKFTFSSHAIAFYGLNILLINLSGWLIIHYAFRHQTLLENGLSTKAYAAQRLQYAVVALLYACAVALGFVLPDTSVFVYVLITIYLIIATLYPRYSWRRSLS